MPELSELQAQTVCLIFLDMPEIGTWKHDARRIFFNYRQAAEIVLNQDAQGPDQDKSYQAQTWLAELRGEGNYSSAQQVKQRRTVVASDLPPIGTDSAPPLRRKRMGVSESSGGDRGPGVDGQSVVAVHSNVDPPPLSSPPPPSSAPVASPAPSLPPPSSPPASPPRLPRANPEPSAPLEAPYTGPSSGTLTSRGGPIPQNAEYVFRGLPPGKIQLDYDTRIWEARVVPSVGDTQRVLVKNKSSGPQNRCVLKWTLIP